MRLGSVPVWDGGAEPRLVGWSGVYGAWMEQVARDHGRGGMQPDGRQHGGALAEGAGRAGPWASERLAALLGLRRRCLRA